MTLESQGILLPEESSLYKHYPKTYNTWKGMRERCHNRKHQMFYLYGGRGITVCERWDSFKNFIIDMGIKPSGKQIDRIDSDKNYSPDNCRWVTQSQNNANRRCYSKSGFKNVFVRPSGRYAAHIREDGVDVIIGTFDTAEDAARAHDLRSVQIYGDKSSLNFPRSDYANRNG